jgi:hypothetical protein
MAVNQIFARVSHVQVHVDKEWSSQNGTWWAEERLHDRTLVLAK